MYFTFFALVFSYSLETRLTRLQKRRSGTDSCKPSGLATRRTSGATRSGLMPPSTRNFKKSEATTSKIKTVSYGQVQPSMRLNGLKAKPSRNDTEVKEATSSARSGLQAPSVSNLSVRSQPSNLAKHVTGQVCKSILYISAFSVCVSI